MLIIKSLPNVKTKIEVEQTTMFIVSAEFDESFDMADRMFYSYEYDDLVNQIALFLKDNTVHLYYCSFNFIISDVFLFDDKIIPFYSNNKIYIDSYLLEKDISIDPTYIQYLKEEEEKKELDNLTKNEKIKENEIVLLKELMTKYPEVHNQ